MSSREFLEKMDSEGGVTEMLMWGGPGCFPPELREDAELIERERAARAVV